MFDGRLKIFNMATRMSQSGLGVQDKANDDMEVGQTPKRMGLQQNDSD